MKRALLIAPAASVLRNFCTANIKSLENLGYRISLTSNFKSPDTKKQKQYDDFCKWCELKQISTHNINFSRHSFFKNISAVLKLKKYIKANEFDLIHCHTETGGLLSSLAMPKKCKKIYTPHGISFYKGASILKWLVFYPIERWICGRMDYVFTINTEEYETINRWQNNTTVLVHGIGLDVERIEQSLSDKTELRKEFGINGDDFFILCVGELNENKNHKTVIDAIARLKNPHIKCVICGIGNLKDDLQNTIDALGLSDNITLAGYRTDVPQLLHAADVLAFPSFHEGLPVSVMEAMSAGIPVICSRIRGNVDLIEDGNGGYLCTPSSSEEFAEKISQLIHNPQLRQSMGQHNKQTIKNYSIDAVIREITAIYEK